MLEVPTAARLLHPSRPAAHELVANVWLVSARPRKALTLPLLPYLSPVPALPRNMGEKLDLTSESSAPIYVEQNEPATQKATSGRAFREPMGELPARNGVPVASSAQARARSSLDQFN